MCAKEANIQASVYSGSAIKSLEESLLLQMTSSFPDWGEILFGCFMINFLVNTNEMKRDDVALALMRHFPQKDLNLNC